jgi:hypothetical protein
LGPGIARGGIKLAVGYAKLSKRDVSGLGDVAEEARLLAQSDGRQVITFEDVERAIKEQLLPSDESFERALNASSKGVRQQLRSSVPAPMQAECTISAEPANFDADSAEEALAAEDFPQRDTRPANLGERNSGARVLPGSHRQNRPALAPV